MSLPSTEPELSGRVAVVTGGGKLIGRAISLAFAEAGAAVAVVAHTGRAQAEETAEAIRSLGGQAHVVMADVSKGESVEAMMDTVVAQFGRIDILVNNAGIDAHAPLISLTEADWDSVFAVHAKGTFLCGAAAARRMLPAKSGVIINIAGASAHRSWPGGGAYAPAKAAVVNLTRQMALEWAPAGIRVNGVSPGPIVSAEPDWRVAFPEYVERFGKLPLQRPGTPEEVASAVRYLASPQASYITGQMLVVDGGSTATWYMTA
ncbi:beta-ketoacyl-ACP reductase [Kaistia sp. 32K]|uniref:SDR family NAD(P)-dependent oxidoreductase n=1 Tax=Kaistia sp. 32K TaxID=2795690 RepID=UPI0019156DB3|nr:glucose 1-dehydrogenase [Kaistia sp. 32K]BCP56080.1 beta-ketoacyl-ACP reductase [Kaistia sp. 32K]